MIKTEKNEVTIIHSYWEGISNPNKQTPFHKSQNLKPKRKKKRYFGHWGEEEEITCDTKIHSQKHRPNEFVAPNKGFLWRRWRSSGVCIHRRRRGEPVRFLLPPKLLQLCCYRRGKLCIKTRDLIWFSTIFFSQKKERGKKMNLFGACWYIALEDLLHSFFPCLSLTLHQPYSTIQPFQISILNSTPVLNSTMLDHTVSHAYDTFFSF